MINGHCENTNAYESDVESVDSFCVSDYEEYFGITDEEESTKTGKEQPEKRKKHKRPLDNGEFFSSVPKSVLENLIVEQNYKPSLVGPGPGLILQVQMVICSRFCFDLQSIFIAVITFSS